jgi:hypothetical protein
LNQKPPSPRTALSHLFSHDIQRLGQPCPE